MVAINDVKVSTSSTSPNNLSSLQSTGQTQQNNTAVASSTNDLLASLAMKEQSFRGNPRQSAINSIISTLVSITQTLVQAFVGILQNLLSSVMPQTPPANGTPPNTNPPATTNPPQDPAGSEQPVSNQPGADCKCPTTGDAGKKKDKKEPKDLGKTGQFLWKPVSEKDKNLVILVPTKLSDDVKSVKILSPNGEKVLSKGRYSGVGNGERAHFRFDKPGDKFPDNAIVEITLKNGSVKRVKIPETSQRFQK